MKYSPANAYQGSIRHLDAGTMSLTAMTLREILALCFYVRSYQITGGPVWIAKSRFDVTGKDPRLTATAPTDRSGEAWSAAMNLNNERMKGLLRERFALKLHKETRLVSGFTLVTVKGARFDAKPCSTSYRLQQGWVEGEVSMASLASLLKADMEAPVQDGTGLRGCYHLQGHWTNDLNETSSPQIFTALQDMGLRLEKAKLDVDILVIDHAELPTPD